MDHRLIIERALREAQDLLWANLPADENLPDETIVSQLRDLFGTADVRAALRCGADDALSFHLRAGARVLADDSVIERAIIAELWRAFDRPELNKLLAIEQNSRIKIGTRPRRKR